MSPPAIPWAAILTHGPTIVASARRLLETVGTNRLHEKNQSIEARLNQLEKASLDSAQLIQELAQQIEALTTAQASAARRARMSIVISVAAAVAALVALIVALS